MAETFLTAWRRLEQVPTGSARPWLYRVARNTLANQRRSKRRRERVSGDPQFLDERDRQRWIELGRAALVAKTPFSGVLEDLPPAWYDGPLDLPSDGDAVYEQFEEDAEASTRAPGTLGVDLGGSMFLHFADVLREARATPE